MIPGNYDLCLYRGDTGRWQFRLWQDAAKTMPVDLSGCTARAQIRNAPDGGTVIDMVCTITPPNWIDMVLAAGAQPPMRGVWDIQVEYPSGDVTTVLSGRVTTQADVTSAAA